MTAKPVQISMDTDLLDQIDRDPEVREKGRSAFIRSAVKLYLTAKRRRAIDGQIARAYEGQADDMQDEIVDLMSDQAWPKE
jgi:metal-responsive CopG/Arc/MetJ family transcriptional regulator